MADLGFAIVGSGAMARVFALCLANHTRGAKLRAIWGGSRAPAAAAEFGAALAPSLEELVARDDVDAVIVTSPHANHREHCLAAAAARKHLFLEKPMEVSLRRCDQIIRACFEAGVTLGLAHVVRFRGTHRRAKELIDRGAIGQVQQIFVQSHFVGSPAASKSWTLDPVHGGIFLDAGAHFFDQIRWLSGAEARRVYAVVADFRNYQVPYPTALVTITMANGVLAAYWMCYELPAPGFRYPRVTTRVVGSEGLLHVDLYGKLELGRGDRWETVWEQPTVDFFKDLDNPIRLESFAAELQDFVDAVREGRPPASTGADGRAAVEIVMAAHRSHQGGQAIRLPME